MQYSGKVVIQLLPGSLLCLVAALQTAPVPQAAAIFGRILNADTHEPVRRANMKVYNSGNQRDEFTDGEGRFSMAGLPPGEYTLVAHRTGFSDRFYRLDPSDFAAAKELPIELRAQAVIAGRAIDGSGQPLQGARVEALTSRVGGKIDVIGSADTNDLGEYRLSGLDPGTYRLRATYRDGQTNEFDTTPLTIATAYYGGADEHADASVKAGSLVTGVDFILNPLRPVTIRGMLRTEAGPLIEPVSLWIMGHAGEGGHNGSGRDGKFEIGNVAPGTYTVSAETLRETDALFGIAMVEIRDSDPDAIDLLLRPLPRLSGEFQMEDGSVADLPPGSVYFTRVERVTAINMRIVQLASNGRFVVELIPGEYSFTFDTSIASLGVQSVTLNGAPVTNWRLQIDGSLNAKNLVVVLGSKRKP